MNARQIVDQLLEAKVEKVYKVTKTRHRTGQKYEFTGTLDELINTVFGYTLEKGASWQHEKGNKKINRHPKNIAALIANLNAAVNNAAANGYAGESYEAVEVSAAAPVPDSPPAAPSPQAEKPPGELSSKSQWE
jgi:hypothetical protein